MSAVSGDECEKANESVRRTRSGRAVRSVTPNKPPPTAKRVSTKPARTIKKILETEVEQEEVKIEPVAVKNEESITSSEENTKELIDELVCDPNAPENEVLDFEPATNEDALDEETEGGEDEQTGASKIDQDQCITIIEDDTCNNQNEAIELDDVNENKADEYENEEYQTNQEQQLDDPMDEVQVIEDQTVDNQCTADQDVDEQVIENENVVEPMYEDENVNEQMNVGENVDEPMNEGENVDEQMDEGENTDEQIYEGENVYNEANEVDPDNETMEEQTNENDIAISQINDNENFEEIQTNQNETYANGIENSEIRENAEDADAEIAEDTLVLHDDEPLQDTFEPKTEPDMEAVSEDELPTEAAAKRFATNFLPDVEQVSEDEFFLNECMIQEPETEAVSDEELPAATAADLGETESVSEDELPPDSERKKKGKSSSKTPEKKHKQDAVKRKLNADGEYDPGSPTSETNDETPAKKIALSLDADTADKDAKPSSPKRKSLPELEKYWKAVNEDPTDFTGWTYLLQYVDQENDAEAAREAYNKFLERYPYCYGYWRKFADYEKKKGDPERVQTVFDQGLNAISLSVDLWLHYITYCKSIYEKDEEKMREQYERAIQSCGLEFRSDRLWESYIKWELDGKRLNKVTALYDRLLTTPTLGYISHFESFQEFVSANSPNRILSVDDFLSIRAEVKALLKSEDSTASAVSDEAPPGEEPADDMPPTDEETRMIREKIISSRRKLHKANVNAVSARWSFEEGIKRPYFHVKPLERCQLKNWKEYLDFEIEQKDQERIIILFERCLIACALYEEFWMRFVRYLESQKSDNTEKIRNVYMRACTTHHPKKPNLHLQWAAFEENQGNLEKASCILENIDSALPNMLQVAYRRINLERRKGDLDQACVLYESYISNSKNRTIANNIVVKYARFLCKVKNDIDKAVKILLKATEKDKDNPRLYLQLIDLGLQRSPIDHKEVIGYMDMFIDREHADLEQRLLFAQRKVEFLEDFSPDIRQVLKAHDQFQKCIKQAKDSRKKAKSEESKLEMSPPRKSKSSSDHTNFPPPPVGSQSSYQYSGSSSSAYQQQPQYQSSQYSSQSGYGQPSYQQYPQQSDPNYANYQNWQYNQSGTQAYGQYNQWGSYNYY